MTSDGLHVTTTTIARQPTAKSLSVKLFCELDACLA